MRHFQFRRLITAGLTKAPAKVDRARATVFRSLIRSFVPSHRVRLFAGSSFARAQDYPRNDSGKRLRDFFRRQLYRENGFRDVAARNTIVQPIKIHPRQIRAT